MHAVHRSDGTVVCARCIVADSTLARLTGLLGRKTLPAGEGILLRPAGSVHMAFMRFAIDAVFLDRELVVIDVAAGLRPWRIAGRRRARAVLELPAGEAERQGLAPGVRLAIGPRQVLSPAATRS